MIKISRSKLELFTECPRCFWLEVKKGIKRPPSFPYTINSSIDYLLKQEFDQHRSAGTPHPIMEAHSIMAVPFAHADIDQWRHNFTGVQVQHHDTDFLVFGAVDDIWVNPAGELHVVDYKSTGSNQHQIYDSYRRQMEIYQWLLRQNGFPVSPTGYFVFAQVNKAHGFAISELAARGLDGKGAVLPFDVSVEGMEGDDGWVEDTIYQARMAYDLDAPPAASPECQHCAYVSRAAEE